MFYKLTLLFNNKKYKISQIKTSDYYSSYSSNELELEIGPETYEELKELYDEFNKKPEGKILNILIQRSNTNYKYEVKNYYVSNMNVYQGFIQTLKLDLRYESLNLVKESELGFFKE